MKLKYCILWVFVLVIMTGTVFADSIEKSVQPIQEPGCGNNICESGETSTSCPSDCGMTPTCTDSDGGKDYYIKGTAHGISSDGSSYTKIDTCINGYELKEYYCIDDKTALPSKERVTCPNGCSDGACKEAPPTAGDLVAEYHFDEGYGSTAYDSSGNGNDGVIYGATWGDGVSSKALSFDGVDDYILINNSPVFSNLEALTVTAWVKFENKDVFYDIQNKDIKMIVSKYWDDYINSFAFSIQEDNSLGMGVGSSENDWLSVKTARILNPSQWHHVVGVYDQTDPEKIILYINGKRQNTAIKQKKGVVTTLGTHDKPLQIGRYRPGRLFQYNGTIDELKIYNYALSADEIKAEYEKYVPPIPETGLAAEYHFDDNAQDSSGNGNHGTVNGATYVDGISGEALSFDGVDDYIEVPHTASLMPSQVTVEAWVKFDDVNTTQRIISKYSDLVGGYELIIHSAWRARAFFRVGQHPIYASYAIASPGEELQVGQWYHLVGVADGSNVSIYVNGDLKASVQQLGAIGSNPYNLFIGTGQQYKEYFTGAIDEVKIYNRALSSSEIREEYEKYKSPLKQSAALKVYDVEGSKGQKVAIKGKLTASNGKPLSGKTISIYKEALNGGYKTLTCCATTDADGIFSAYDLIEKENGVYADYYKAVFRGDNNYRSSTDYATLVVNGGFGGIYVHLNEKFELNIGQEAKVVDYKYMKITLNEIIPPVEAVMGAKFRAQITVSLPRIVTTSKTLEEGVSETPPSPTPIDIVLKEGKSADAFDATITLLDINSDKATFIVESKAVEDFVDIEIMPKEQTIVYGEQAEYKVVVKDKHPINMCAAGQDVKCIQDQYTYEIDMRNLPFSKKYPKTVTVYAGQSASFPLTVMPFTVIAEPAEPAEKQKTGIVSEVKQYIGKLSNTKESASAPVLSGAGGAAVKMTPQKANAISPPQYQREYNFNVRAKLKGDPKIQDIDYATLIVRPKGPIKPPDFPEEEVTIKLYRGWNLVSIPGKLVKFNPVSMPQKKLVAFVYLKDEKRYVTLKQAEEILGAEFGEYLAKNAFWIYSYENHELSMEIDKEMSFSGITLNEGWNLVPITEDMVGGYLSDIRGNCEFERMYLWDVKRQGWIKISEDYAFSSGQLNYGFILKSNNYCRLGGVVIEEPVARIAP